MSKEINLLPLPRRRQLARRFFEHTLLRLGISVLLGLLVVTLVGVATLVGFTIASSVLFPAVRADLEQAIIDYRAETRAISERNALIADMQKQHEAHLTWSQYVPDVLKALSAGTEISELAGDYSAKKLTLSGRAVARSSLIVLEDKLTALLWAQAVEAPVTNLLERLSPEFTFLVQL